MVVKIKESFEKTRHVKNNDKSKKYSLSGQRNVRYHEKILSNKKKSYNFVNFLENGNRYKVDIFCVNITFDDLSKNISYFDVA